jgi:CubicO group peptidase (beta-lactamase class C family)
MIRRALLLLFLGGVLHFSACSKKNNVAGSEGTGTSDKSSAKVSAKVFPPKEELLAHLKSRVDEGGVVGVVLAVREADGSHTIVSHGSAGTGAKPLSAKSVFEIGSISKVFTGILLAEMQIRGEVEEQDYAQDHAHDGVTMPRFQGTPIRLLDLATHMSGLPRLPANLRPADPSNPYADYSVEQLHSFLSSVKLERDVGAKHEYSNLGTGLLGHLLASINKSTWEELARARILAPLGMTMTAVKLSPEMQSQLARGHDNSGKPANNWDIPTLAGAGALRSNAEDMLKFLDANLATDAGPLTIAMQSSHRPRVDTGETTKIGLNWFTQRTAQHALVWHNGGTGGYYSFIGFDRQRNVGVLILANSTHSLDDLGMHLLDPSIPLTGGKKRTEIEVPEQLLSEYVGVYELTPNFHLNVTLENGSLYTQATGQPKIQVYAESEVDFFLKVTDAQLTFSRNSLGTIDKVVLHQNGQDHPAKRLLGEPASKAIKSIKGKEREEVKVKMDLLLDYVGVYELTPSFKITISIVSGQMQIQATNQPASPIYAESDSKFFSKVVDAQITFVRESGLVTKLILHQGGMDQTAVKVEEE